MSLPRKTHEVGLRWRNFLALEIYLSKPRGTGTSVADPGCLFRIPDPDFSPSRIPDPKTSTKERGEKNLLSYLFCSHKFHKIEKYLIFEMLKKKIWPSFQRIIELFTQTFVTK